MRKLYFAFLTLTGIFLLASQSLLAQEQNLTWDYPLKPGMPEWKNLLSHKAMVDACQIPVNTLPTLSTDRLVELCLSFPLFFTMGAFNNLQEGFEQVSTECTGFQELFKRPDAGKVLLRLYQSLDPKNVEYLQTPLERGLYKQKIFFLEFILSQKIIIDNFTEGEIRMLLSETLIKLEDKAKFKYSTYGTLTTSFIMCKVLENKNYGEFKALITRNNSYLIFSKTVMLSDLNMIDELKSLVKNYLSV